ISAMAAGSVNTTWKYGTGSRSASRAASQSFAAAPWHFGQCRLRQELYAIWLYAHFSQRATCPPRAAVRQLSIADITFNWPRLTWPALALRHAGPWPRKISATSSFGGATCASGGRLVLGFVLLERQRRETIQRAHDLADRVGGDTGVERRRLQLRVAEQDLDHPDIDVLFEQMRCKAVPQRMRGHTLGNLGHVGRGVAGAGELACRHRGDRVLAREQPALRPRNTIPVAQKFEQHRGKHRVAVLAAFALVDAQHHAFGIDIGYLQGDDLGNTKPGTVGDTQRRLVLDARCRLQKARNLLGAQDDRHLARLVHERQVPGKVGAVERHIEEEPQRRDGGVDLRRAGAARRQMQPKAAHILQPCCVGRATKERGEILDPLHVVMLGFWRELTDRHVFGHASTQRADSLLGHGDAPVSSEVVKTPRSQDRTPRPAMMLAAPLAAARYRASGLVP